jgi:hypothetical protein
VEVVDLVSEKAKANIMGTFFLAGFLISAFMAVVLFGPYFEFRFITFDENLTIVILSIGIAMTAMSLGALQRSAKKLTKETIANFVNPLLKSKGKVSAREIIDKPLKGKIEIGILMNTYLEPMLQEGYFEDTRLEGGWLMKNVSACGYCGNPVESTEKNCHNCGAIIKR